MVFVVADSGIAIRRDFVITLGDGCRNGVRMQVAPGLGMNQAQHMIIGNVFERRFGIVKRIRPIGIEEPVVVGVFVMVASDLLLLRTFGIGLNVRM